jgi:Acyl-CoA thioester hydrolase/BAAT N-terminal region
MAGGASVTVTARAVDARGQHWRSQATFRADRHGTVDLDRAAPRAGSYQRPDGMGLFWSLDPVGAPADEWAQRRR